MALHLHLSSSSSALFSTHPIKHTGPPHPLPPPSPFGSSLHPPKLSPCPPASPPSPSLLVLAKSIHQSKQHLNSGRSLHGLETWIAHHDEEVRRAPLLLGSASFLAVLLNRSLSGVAPVADASSAQSRADVLTLALAATVVLTGLVWISIKPKPLTAVKLSGIECIRVDSSLPPHAAKELLWAWETLRNSTCCQALVVVYRCCCLLQAGLAAESQTSDGKAIAVDPLKLVDGSLCRSVWASGKQSYLANLSLYPGRFELTFLPPNTQVVIVQPLGDEGVMIVAGDTVRGFGPTDQAWIGSIGEKLDATLGKCALEASSVGV